MWDYRGVEYIRLIDFDQVTLSSLNRHATATQADVGTSKVHCIARTLRAISRNVEVDCRVELWRLEDFGGELLEGVDWVVGMSQIEYHWSASYSWHIADAIDNISTKVELLKYCHDNNIKVRPLCVIMTEKLCLTSPIGILLYGCWGKIRPYTHPNCRHL